MTALSDTTCLAIVDRIEWRRSSEAVPYAAAVAAMERRVEAILAGRAAEVVWLLEHPPVYTGGASARPEEVLDPGDVPVMASARGGRYTFHGPGQRIAYLMIDVGRRGRDLRRFVAGIEDWVIAALGTLGVTAARREGRVGIWVAGANSVANSGANGGEAKIGAVGLRLRRWVSSHGVAINVCPNLRYFDGIVPCGLGGYGVTSLHALGRRVTPADLDTRLLEAFHDNFIGNFPCALDAGPSLNDERSSVP